jgi:hypothetical protein
LREHRRLTGPSLPLLAGFFSILLGGEELFGIGRRKTTELSAVAGAVQDRYL